ncbi:MAG: hypothetical protein ACXWQO_19555 [Bdellovibrionota bacterium]
MKTKLLLVLALTAFSGAAHASEQSVFTCHLENNPNIIVRLGVAEGVREHLLEVVDGKKLLVSDFAREILFKAIQPYREFGIFKFNGRVSTLDHSLRINDDGKSQFGSESLNLSGNCIPE